MIVTINHRFNKLTVSAHTIDGVETSFSVDVPISDVCIGHEIVERVKDEWDHELDEYYRGDRT